MLRASRHAAPESEADDAPLHVAKQPHPTRHGGELAGTAQLFCATQVRPGLGKMVSCLTPRSGARGNTSGGSSEPGSSLGDARRPRSIMSKGSVASRLSARLSVGRRWSAGEADDSSAPVGELCWNCLETLPAGAAVCAHCGEPRDGSDGDPSAPPAPSIGSRLSVTRRTRVRRATLAKFEGTIRDAARRQAATMDAGFQRRLKDARSAFHRENATQRMARTRTLRKDFFRDVPLQDLVREWREEHEQRDVFSDVADARDGRDALTDGARADARARGESAATATTELLDVPAAEEEMYNREVDEVVEEYMIEARKRAKVAGDAMLRKAEKQLHLAKVKQVKDLRNNLLAEQGKLLSEVRARSKAVIKGLRKHAAELTRLINAKATEADDVDADTEGAIAQMDALAEAFSASVSKSGADAGAGPAARGGSGGGGFGFGGDGFAGAFARASGVDARERAQQLLQQRFEERMGRLQNELATTLKHLHYLELEQTLPKVMQWKVRLNSGDGLFIGIRDLDLETVDGDVEMSRGAELGTVHLQVTNLRAVLGMYQFSIDGSTAKAKLLRGILTPTVNRLDVEVRGSWTLKLRFQEGSGAADHLSRWVKDESVFELQLTKAGTGLGLVRMPDRVIKWLVTSLIPTVISNAVMLNLPVRLGAFFLHPQNFIRVRGKVHIRGDVPPRVWCAPLVAPTASGKLARRAMGVTDQEAVFLDFLLRSDLATCAGFHRKAISMNRFFKWRLQYASVGTGRLAKMLSIIEKDPSVNLHFADPAEAAAEANARSATGPSSGSSSRSLLGGGGSAKARPPKVEVPDGWALQLLNRVCEVAQKPATFDLSITGIEADVNVKQGLDVFTGMYIEALEHEVDRAAGPRAQRLARREAERAKARAARLRDGLETNMASLLSDKIALDVRAVLAGGLSTGIIMATVRNLLAEVKLPSGFELSWLLGQAPMTSEGFNLTLAGEAGPEEGEYTLQARHKFVNPRDNYYPYEEGSVPDEDAQAIIRDLQLNLFPRGARPGTVRLAADSVRAALYMSTLGEATFPLPSPDDDTRAAALGRSRRDSASDDVDERSGGGGGGQPASAGDELLQSSRKILSELWARYNASTAAAAGAAAGRSGSTSAEHARAHRVREHPVLPGLLTDERHDLLVDVRGVRVEAIREIGVDQKDTIRLTVYPSETERDPGGVVASWHVRFSLAQFFEDDADDATA